MEFIGIIIDIMQGVSIIFLGIAVLRLQGRM